VALAINLDGSIHGKSLGAIPHMVPASPSFKLPPLPPFAHDHYPFEERVWA